MRRNLKIGAGIAGVLAIGLGIAFAAGLLYLPAYPVTVTHGPWLGGLYSTLDITLSNVGDGYDVSDGRYNGWCIEDNLQPDQDGDFPLVDSTDDLGFPSPCENYANIPWPQVNYVLNHKQGDVYDVQIALWVVAGTDWYTGYSPGDDADVDAMIAGAQANPTFVPGPGQIVAVGICSDGLSVPPNDWREFQDTIIEVMVPPDDFEGCTPGYWRQPQHFGSWLPTGYSPDDDFETVFGVDVTFGEPTLLEAVWMRGGMERALLRHAVAALLNASNPDVNYPYTASEVIAMVQGAYASGDFNGVKDQFEMANEMWCPLGRALPAALMATDQPS